jgi:molecular chaperone DnaK (HSP70)
LVSTKRDIGTNWSKNINGKTYTPVDAAAMILEEIKNNIGDEAECVITIPAYFNEKQREDTLKAAQKAGLKVLRLLTEPTAAAISYGLDKEKDQTIIVIDFGGGTFDVSLLEVKGNKFTTKAVDGNSHLGGDDIDNAIVEYLLEIIKDEHGEDLRNDNKARAVLKEYAEKAKIELAGRLKTEIYIPSVGKGLTVETELTRNQLKEMIEPILKEIVSKTNDVISSAGMDVDDINRFVLVGGSCKHPLVQEAVKDNFKEPYFSGNLDTIVSEGAAIVCATSGYMEEDTHPLDFKEVISHTIGESLLNPMTNRLFIRHVLTKNTEYPVKKVTVSFPVSISQTRLLNEIYRGESSEVYECKKLGELEINILPDAVGKETILQLTIFELDKNGTLHFSSAQILRSSPEYRELQSIITTNNYDIKDDIDFEPIDRFLTKHNIERKKIEIKAVV